MKGLGWITGGNDRQLAATTYAGQESASDRRTRLERERAEARATAKRVKQQTQTRRLRAQGVAAAARAGEAWEDADRRRFR